MANVVFLEPGVVPPDGEDWAFLRYLEGGWEGSGSASYRDGATFYVPANIKQPDFEAAVTDAKIWADLNGVQTVYVQRMASA